MKASEFNERLGFELDNQQIEGINTLYSKMDQEIDQETFIAGIETFCQTPQGYQLFDLILDVTTKMSNKIQKDRDLHYEIALNLLQSAKLADSANMRDNLENQVIRLIGIDEVIRLKLELGFDLNDREKKMILKVWNDNMTRK